MQLCNIDPGAIHHIVTSTMMAIGIRGAVVATAAILLASTERCGAYLPSAARPIGGARMIVAPTLPVRSTSSSSSAAASVRSSPRSLPRLYSSTLQAVDISIPYDAAAKLAYDASDKSIPYADFKAKYEADAVTAVIAKQPIDVSIPYDAPAKLAYESGEKSVPYADFKAKYEADAVAAVKAKRSGNDAEAEAPIETSTAVSTETVEEGGTKKSLWGKIRDLYRPKEGEEDLTFKQKLAKAGLSALLSYGFVSNMSYSVTVSLAWFGFSKKTGLSPLAPGQWKPFLAVYAGFYVFNNIVRPIRLAVSVAVTPYFDRAVASVQRRTKVSKKAAIGLVVFLANFCGTLTAMGLGITLASLASGVPIFVPKA